MKPRAERIGANDALDSKVVAEFVSQHRDERLVITRIVDTGRERSRGVPDDQRIIADP